MKSNFYKAVLLAGLFAGSAHAFSLYDTAPSVGLPQSHAIKYNTYVVLVTTGSNKNVNEILEYFHHEDLFDEVFTQDDVEEQKPSPQCFIKAMEHFKMSPEDSFIYEDSDVGLKAAYKSGANVIKVGKF